MTNLHWSEKQLEVHLNKHNLRKECATVQFKNKIEAKTHEAEQNAVDAKLERNSVGGGMGSKIINTPGAKEKAALLYATYCEHWSVHKVSEIHEVAHSVVHRYLKAFGYKLKGEKFSKDEDELIKDYYQKTPDSEFDLDYLTGLLGRPEKTSVSRRARLLGVSDQGRCVADKHKETFSSAAKERIQKYGHPKGFLGRKHNEESLKIISEKSNAFAARVTPEERANITMRGQKTKAEKGNLYQPRTKSSWKQQWAEINGVRKFYRSQWELNYAYYLEWLRVNGQIKSWLHEPETFWFDGVKRGTCSYLPDFKVEGNDGRISFHEVKGWMDDRSKTKLKRMAKYHPDVVLVLIDTKAYKQIERKLSKVVPGWA